ncbi:MAG: ATP-binding cassette domain-containing protein [Pseudomonadales bacterium]|nr:ATP-binding cassette domain-containing protein [Pseudomonadales bacterium]
MIEARQLVRRYGEFAAVDGVSFSISPGEVVGLLGHNGAGKTTIMKMLTGYIEPSSGEVLVDGIDVQSEPLAVQAKMGYLPESLPIYPELTVADYLAHTAQLRGLDPQATVPDALDSTQLADKAFERIDTLSRGYKQRLGVAQAILHKPKFLILDEPSNGLDPNQIQHMRALIRNLAQQATVILSTHIMQEVSAVCDRALIVRGGKLVVDERLSDLQRSTQAHLRTNEDAAVDAILRGLASVQETTSLGDGAWSIELQGEGTNAISAIAAALVGADVPIYSLAPESRDLEAIFTEANQAEEVIDAA